MKFFMRSKISLVIIGFVAGVLVTGGGSANAEFIFGTPTNLGPTVNTAYAEGYACISADGLSLYFNYGFWDLPPGGYGGPDLWVMRRATTNDEWGPPVNLGPTVNSSASDGCPSISSDDLSLYFASNRQGGYGGGDIWVTKRATTEDEWGPPVNLGPTVNSSSLEQDPSISTEGLSLFFMSDRAGTSGPSDLWVTTRETINDDWGTPVNLGPTVNSSGWDASPDISADGLVLFFSSDRHEGSTSCDLWMATRTSVSEPFGPPVFLEAINTSHDEDWPSISTDGRTLFFESDRPGGSGGCDLWQVSIEPVVDFNGDGIVDLADFSKLAQYWFQNESSVEIAPEPFGDHMVDFKDLAVLVEHWLEVSTIEDFETGDFSTFNWTFSGHANWTVTSRERNSGDYSAQAGSIGDDEYTTLEITLDCVSGDISFYRKVSSESGYDYLNFYIDDEEKGEWSGRQEWMQVSFPVTAGTRTFAWVYSKDGSDYSGSDTAWIDDIVFPIGPYSPPSPPPAAV